MEAKELRIGNWILNPHELFHKIEDIEDLLDAHELKPIELTEELFNTIKTQHDNFEICFNEGKFYLCEENDPNYSYCIRLPNIKYLHQLQNLFFALTNEELEINL